MVNNTKTILFASLIAAMILPFSGMQFAAADTNEIYDPSMVEYLLMITQQNGNYIEEKTLDEDTYTVTKNIKQVGNHIYKVINEVAVNNEQITSDQFIIIKTSDTSLTLVNVQEGTQEKFTSETDDFSIYGTGNSNFNGAAIQLHDKEYGTPGTLYLYDNYNGCGGFNQAVMEATVRSNTIDVTWEASPFYNHYCIYPHEWEDGYVQYGTAKHYLYSEPNHDDRRSSTTFTNTHGGTTWYSVTAYFSYGGW